jgi:hypothetical protein
VMPCDACVIMVTSPPMRAVARRRSAPCRDSP